MVDRGPLLTSAIIFYLSIGAAIFQVLEEPNWKKATKDFDESKSKILDKYTCLTLKDLEEILESVSSAAGQGVTITGNATFNNWNWANAVIFAATVITTIGYGNIAPKTSAGRLFCIFYGLFGVPLCLTWISALGKFFAGRAKRLGQFLTRRGVTLRKAQITCTAIFIIWGVLVHLVIPPFIFMSTEDWNYIEGLYFSFITISTIGFGDYVAGVNPKKDYSVLYRYFVEIWIYLGLAWLSLFINWKVSMFVEVHKAIKKRRKKRKESFDYDPRTKKNKQIPMAIPKDVNIPGFLSKKEETYNDLIKQIGLKKNVGKILTGELQDNVPNKDKEVMVMYNKRNSFGYDAVTFTNGFHRDNGLRSMPDREATIFINQLDRISEEEGEPWESKDYKPLIFQNANITFVNEEEECDLSEDDEKSKSSIDENNANSETPNRLDDEFTCLDEASFSSNDMEVSVPYELLNDYHKLDIEASVPYEPLLNDHHKIDNNGDIEASVPYEQLLNDHHKIDNNGDMEASVNYAQLLNDHHKVDASVSYEQLLNDHHKMDNKGDMEASVPHEPLLSNDIEASFQYTQVLNDFHKIFNKGDT